MSTAVLTGTNVWFLEFLLFLVPVVLWLVVIGYRNMFPTNSKSSGIAVMVNQAYGEYNEHGSCNTGTLKPGKDSYFSLYHLGEITKPTMWLSQPAVVLTRSTASSWLTVIFVEIALLGAFLLNAPGSTLSRTVLMWPLLYVER